MKAKYIKALVVLIFMFSFNAVSAQSEEVRREKQQKVNIEQERIKDPDLKHHEMIRPPHEREIQTRKLSPEEIELIKPVWVCPSHRRTNNYYSGYSVNIFNFSHDVVFVRAIFYDKEGKVENILENKLEGKHTWYINNYHSNFNSVGPIEIYANSKAIYPEGHETGRAGGYYDAVNDDMDSEYAWASNLQWHRIDH